MKHRNSTIAASAAAATLAISIAFAPAAAFASGGHNRGGNFFSHFASFFHFGARLAYAQGSTTTPINKAPSISGITAPTKLTAGAEGSWTVNASDPEDGSLSYSVDWGDAGFLKSLLATSGFVQSSSFTHTYANPGTYTVKFVVKDEGGKTASASATVHVVADQSANPVISGLAAVSKTQTHATITWKTDLKSDSTVYYSTTTPVDTATALSAHESGQVSNHSVQLNKLTAGTTYYYLVVSKTAGGGSATSAEGSVTTKAAPGTTPKIASFTGPATLAADTEGTWSVKASDPKGEDLSYSIDWGDTAAAARAAAMAVSQESTYSHTYSAAGTYIITLTVKNADGLSATASTKVVVTAAPAGPALSGAKATVTDSSIAFAWKTDAAADSTVYYSSASPVTTGATGTTAVSGNASTKSHAVNVTGLSAGTTYYFVLESKNDGGTSASHEFSLTTMGM